MILYVQGCIQDSGLWGIELPKILGGQVNTGKYRCTETCTIVSSAMCVGGGGTIVSSAMWGGGGGYYS